MLPVASRGPVFTRFIFVNWPPVGPARCRSVIVGFPRVAGAIFGARSRALQLPIRTRT